MEASVLPDRERITIAILALGGQGGGVLADWIRDLAERNGYIAQVTSVPGVAQRTGSTVYYIEMVRRPGPGANSPAPVLAMMPVPGDVDIVIASELMEAGRAILRGFVSADRTTLIGSTHRIYAISEKAARGDGIAAGQRILDAAERRSARFVGFDMDAVAGDSRSVISSVMFGALAGSGALPFERASFEEAIRGGGKAVAANLKGFEAGVQRTTVRQAAIETPDDPPEPTTDGGRALKARIVTTLPEPCHAFAIEGVRRLMEYQDRAYAELYLDRLEAVLAVSADGVLMLETARHLALWMAFEDTIRVADLKIRTTRSSRIAREMQLAAGQVMAVTEYMHPRLVEVCETMPAWLGGAVLRRPALRRRLEPLFSRGRHVRTTSLRWFLLLRLVASMRIMRRSTIRYAEEQARIERWLAWVREAAATDAGFAVELVRCQRLIKGYSDTFERSLRHFDEVMAASRLFSGRADGASAVVALREAVLSGDPDAALNASIAEARSA